MGCNRGALQGTIISSLGFQFPVVHKFTSGSALGRFWCITYGVTKTVIKVELPFSFISRMFPDKMWARKVYVLNLSKTFIPRREVREPPDGVHLTVFSFYMRWVDQKRDLKKLYPPFFRRTPLSIEGRRDCTPDGVHLMVFLISLSLLHEHWGLQNINVNMPFLNLRKPLLSAWLCGWLGGWVVIKTSSIFAEGPMKN